MSYDGMHTCCDYELHYDEDSHQVEICKKPARYAFHFPGDGVPEAFYCEEHKPEIMVVK